MDTEENKDLEDNTTVTKEVSNVIICPVCNTEMVVSGHCATCLYCGYSLCSM